MSARSRRVCAAPSSKILRRPRFGQRASSVPPLNAQDPWSLLMARKTEGSDLMTAAVERNEVRHGIERIQGRAHFHSPRQVEIEKMSWESGLLEADLVFLASASKPHLLPNIPMNDPDVYDSENPLEIGRAPESLRVIGSGWPAAKTLQSLPYSGLA